MAVGLPTEAIQAITDKHDIKEATIDFSTLYNRVDINTVVIGTPNKFHAPFGIGFLNKGKDVFKEKPMEFSTEEDLTIRKAADANNKLVMVGYMWSFDTDVKYVKGLVAAGELGSHI